MRQAVLLVVALLVLPGCDFQVEDAQVDKLADKADVTIDVDINVSRESLDEVEFAATVSGKADGEEIKQQELEPDKLADMVCQLTGKCHVLTPTEFAQCGDVGVPSVAP